jgi:predicted alpha/beta-hydrolase family hydrolase
MDLGELLTNEPRGAARATLILAHGAGGRMNSPFLNFIAEGLAESGVCVVRFEFPYMRARRRVPDPPAVLMDTWRAVIEKLGRGPQLVIGGKSLGGRIASMIADGAAVRGLICLGYPFHPPGKPQQLRTAHLEALRTPTLVLQGERDPFGTPEEVAGYELSPSIRIEWLPDGDHSFKPRKQSGHTETENLSRAVALVAAFLSGLK